MSYGLTFVAGACTAAAIIDHGRGGSEWKRGVCWVLLCLVLAVRLHSIGL